MGIFDKPTEEEVAGRTEALGNGLALGGGARLGAGMQALMAGASGDDPGETYDSALKENRGILAAQKAREPTGTKVLEAVGGAPTSIALAGKGRGGAIAARLLQAGKTGAALGSVSGALGSDADLGSAPNAMDTLMGLGTGAALGPAVELGITGVKSIPGVGGLLQRLQGEPEAYAQERSFIPGTPEHQANMDRVMRVADRMRADTALNMHQRGTVPKMNDIINPETGQVLISSQPTVKAGLAAVPVGPAEDVVLDPTVIGRPPRKK